MASIMNIDSDTEETTNQFSALSIPTSPLPKPVPIIVHQTGPIDAEYYPIYCNRNQRTNASHALSPHKNTNHTDTNNNIDFIDNDDLFSENENTNTNTNSHSMPHKSQNDAFHHWKLNKSDPTPYFMDETLCECDENELWVKGETVATEEAANNTLIYNLDNELQIGDTISFTHKVRQYSRMGMRSFQSWSTQWREEYEDIKKVQGRITKIGTKDWMNRTEITVRTANNVIYRYTKTKDSDIMRVKQVNRGRGRLYKIMSNSEKCLLAQFLKRELSLPWIIVMDIAAFTCANYQRNIYFDCKAFEKIVKSNYFQQTETENKSAKACDVCTMLNPFENKQCSMCNHEFDTNDNGNHWLESDRCYEEKIRELSVRNHSIFPNNKERHEMYAKKPFLAVIPKGERPTLKIMQSRLRIGLKPDSNLYKYQLHTVLWCYYIERLVQSQQKIYIGSNDLRFTNNENISCNVYTINDKQFIPSDIPRILPPRTLRFRGGIIADDVGLGKSLTCLALIVTNPWNNDIRSDSFDPITHKLKLGKNKKSLKCAATLLIAPSHLIEQWKNEIIKHFKPNTLKILIITTALEHKKISYLDVLNAQIILVSSVFMAGIQYQMHKSSKQNVDHHWRYLDPSLLPPPSNNNGTKRRSTRSQKQKYQDLDQTQIYFELLHFRRVIVDEGHEYLQNEKIRKVIFEIESDFCWYVTATPFPNDTAIGYCADFLDINFESDSEYYPEIEWNENVHKPIGFVLHSLIYNHLFSRHTKESILDDNFLPSIAETVEYVSFHPIERLLYALVQSRARRNHNAVDIERQVCSGVFNAFDRDLGYVSHTPPCPRSGVFHAFTHVSSCESEGYLQRLLLRNKRFYPWATMYLKRDLGRERKHFKQLKEWEMELNQKKQEFEDVGLVFSFKDAYESKQITQTQRENYQRIKQKIQSSNRKINEYKSEIVRCNKEKKMIANANIFDKITKYESEFETKTDGEYLLQIVQKYGSKQAAILENIKTLYSNQRNRIIIFSLFGQTLNSLKYRLAQINVSCVMCVGSVHVRKKAMASFQSDDYNGKNRVILLSVEKAASGANLNKATHVILVDPVPGNKSESFAAERQAVGRAVRQGMSECKTKVIRFVVRDTIEEETYERNKQMREKMNSECKVENSQRSMGRNLNKCLKVKRRNSEIQFFLNINNENNKDRNECGERKKKVKKRKSSGAGECGESEPTKKRRRVSRNRNRNKNKKR